MPARRVRAQLIQPNASCWALPGVPISALGGTRTSVKRSEPVCPSAMMVCWTGPRSTPSAVSETRKAVSSPRPAPSTRAKTCASSAWGAPVIRYFSPEMIQPSASCRALVVSEGKSDPASDSVSAKQTFVRPARKSARCRSRASGLQCANRGLGPSVQAIIHCWPRSPWRKISSWMYMQSTRERPRPSGGSRCGQ